LREVEEGSRPVAAFYQGIVDLVRDLIPKVWAGPAFSPEQVATAQAAKAQGARPGAAARRGKSAAPRPAGLGSCPLCKQGEIQETTRAFGCSRYREGCTFTVWKTIAGLKLTKEQVRQLVAGARVGPLDGFQSKAGKAFSAALRLGEDGKVVFEFGPAAPSTPAAESPAQPQPHLSGSDAAVPAPIGLVCPKCGQGRIIQGHRGFGCDRYRAGCDFAVLREVCGKRLTDLQIAALIRDRRTRLIKGFSDDQGQRFDARLELDEGFKVQPRRTATQDSPPDPAT
jgi:DNA topoisomerase-3